MIPTDIHKRVLQPNSVDQLLFQERIQTSIADTHLRQLRFLVVVHVHQVRFGPKRPQARRLESGPPVVEEIKLFPVVPRMQLDLQLSKRERRGRKRA